MKFSSSHPFRSSQAQKEYQALYAERARAWPVESESRFVETPSGLTFVRVCGPALAPPLILLPGSRGTSLTWIPNIAALCARYRVYALDCIYDFGLSIRRRDIKKPEDMLGWLDEVLTTLIPQGSLSLAGLSYGGWLASLYALRYPERVQKLVLLAPAATVLPVSITLIFRALLTLIPLPSFRRNFYYWLLNDTVQSGEMGRTYVDEAVEDWAVAERCFAPLPLVPATVFSDEALRNSGVPTLVLIGRNEKTYSAHKAVKRLSRIAPQIKAEIIPDAGHDLWYVQAGMVTQKILKFLDEPAIHTLILDERPGISQRN